MTSKPMTRLLKARKLAVRELDRLDRRIEAQHDREVRQAARKASYGVVPAFTWARSWKAAARPAKSRLALAQRVLREADAGKRVPRHYYLDKVKGGVSLKPYRKMSKEVQEALTNLADGVSKRGASYAGHFMFSPWRRRQVQLRRFLFHVGGK